MKKEWIKPNIKEFSNFDELYYMYLKLSEQNLDLIQKLEDMQKYTDSCNNQWY